MFLLDCPNEGAYKNWISQGLSAVGSPVAWQTSIEGHGGGGGELDRERQGLWHSGTVRQASRGAPMAS